MEKVDKTPNHKFSLVDQVENQLISYFKSMGLKPGDSIPNELQLSKDLGVARSVVREALSRFKMVGMIESHTKRGMVMTPISLFGAMRDFLIPGMLDEDTILDLLEFRVVLEIGISGMVFRNCNGRNLEELKNIVGSGGAINSNRYASDSEYAFHSKLYEISGNNSIIEFQKVIHPVLEFVEKKYNSYFEPIQKDLDSRGLHVTHKDLVDLLERRDLYGYKQAVEDHFKVYTIYLNSRKHIE
ncbi:MAG: FCD domain-containing protein [Bacteroidales bacterium]|jgi:DNA-binding FadR family transcriptional regulator|nr:FCD domain-containing protein [Bacteroidales bacterium]MCI2121554.1 FCD domain-containing protein [Bacteroidales bacterium]MCI2145067.1 FCD domain-containing protein [Bacteroidales bacterium]